jgi:NADPH-dependent glutamate synthase beta subunit-like oxidoreductase
MACAADMAKAGCEVIVYEAFHEPGGVLKYGIPDFRLPNSVVDVEIEKLTRLGIRFECNTLVGRLFTIEQMLTEMGFHAVFIGTGAGYPSFMGIPGESLGGVLSANEVADPLQPDARARFPELRHAAAAGQARGRDRCRQHRDGRDAGVLRVGAERSTASTAAAQPRLRRVPRRSTTRSRKVSISSG